MYSNNKNKKISKKTLVIAVVILVSITTLITLELTGTISVYRRNQNESPATSNTAPIEKINLDPPTQKEQNSGDEKKQNITTNSETPDTTQQASVVIVDANQYGEDIEVRAFASNVVADGTCTIVFSKNGTSITREVPARAESSSSPCVSLTLKRTEFNQSGTWNVEVTYSSSAASGSSNISMEIL